MRSWRASFLGHRLHLRGCCRHTCCTAAGASGAPAHSAGRRTDTRYRSGRVGPDRRLPWMQPEGLPAGPTPSLCGDSLQRLQGRPESLPDPAWTDLDSHAGDLHRERPVETSYWSEVTWVPCSGPTRPLIRRYGDSGVSTRRQRATSRSSSWIRARNDGERRVARPAAGGRPVDSLRLRGEGAARDCRVPRSPEIEPTSKATRRAGGPTSGTSSTCSERERPDPAPGPRSWGGRAGLMGPVRDKEATDGHRR